MLGIKTKGGLFKAIARNDLETISAYMKSNAAKWLSVQDDGHYSPFQRAALNGRMEAVMLMLAATPEENIIANAETALILAAGKGHIRIIQAMASNPAWTKAFNNSEWTPLSAAIYQNKLECVKALLETGHVTVMPRHLQMAVSKSPAIFDMILATGVDVNTAVKVHDGTETPLFAAANNIECTNKLLKAGARPNEPAHKSGAIKYPLAAAASHANMQTMAALIAKGADIHAMDSDGTTPLVAAVKSQKIEAVKFLLDNGVHKDLTSALQIALQHKSTDTRVLLQERIAHPTPLKAAAQTDGDTPTETWTRTGEMEMMRVRDYPAQRRRLTDIFNFADAERVFIAENTHLQQETTAVPQSFDSVSDMLLEKAVREFKNCDGNVNEAAVFKNRVGLVKKGV